MQKLPRLSGKEVVKILAKIGFISLGQRGSHIIMKKQTNQGSKALVVPNHKEIDKGTLLEIIRHAGMEKEEFLEFLKN
ncbi:type II toxin-antitoxin system HicA family toxin [Candidatus Woesearchaeota archaeon]|nr:type II toxin-antitoxin system HicA family toxin [Candidatus Woesearchaeota archaeon]